MAIKIDYSQTYKHNICFSDYFQQQNRSIVLLTHFREDSSFYDPLNSYILERFIKLDLQIVDWEQLNVIVTNFFIDLNWELYARFRVTDNIEKGVSLLLVITEADKLFFVSFGRFLCGMLTKDNNSELTRSWGNQHVKTREQLGLLGSIEQDILVKPTITKLQESNSFIAFSPDVLENVEISSLNIYNAKSIFQDIYEKKPFSYCIVNISKGYQEKKKPWYRAKRFRFTAIAMFLMLAFSAYYIYLGKNKVEDRLHITREQFQLTVRNIDLLKIQEMLSLDYGLLFVPQTNLELFVEWESVLSFPVTMAPHYDMRQIFLASSNKLYSYDKRDKKNNWTANLEGNINSIEILDANLLLVTTVDKHSFCLKRDSGEIVWQRRSNIDNISGVARTYKPIQISLEMDRRLNNSLVLFPDKKSLSLLNILTGDTLYYYQADSKIDYISEFDFIDKALYLVKGNKLYKIRIDIKA